MRLGVLAALEQRITVRRHMTGMTSEETAGYIRHHLQLAGRSDPLFTDDAIALSTRAAAANPATSTGSPSPRSSPPAPPVRISSTKPAPAAPSPKTPTTINQRPMTTVATP